MKWKVVLLGCLVMTMSVEATYLSSQTRNAITGATNEGIPDRSVSGIPRGVAPAESTSSNFPAAMGAGMAGAPRNSTMGVPDRSVMSVRSGSIAMTPPRAMPQQGMMPQGSTLPPAMMMGAPPQAPNNFQPAQ